MTLSRSGDLTEGDAVAALIRFRRYASSETRSRRGDLHAPRLRLVRWLLHSRHRLNDTRARRCANTLRRQLERAHRHQYRTVRPRLSLRARDPGRLGLL